LGASVCACTNSPLVGVQAFAVHGHGRMQVAGSLGADVREVSESCSKSLAALQGEVAALAGSKADKVGRRAGVRITDRVGWRAMVHVAHKVGWHAMSGST